MMRNHNIIKYINIFYNIVKERATIIATLSLIIFYCFLSIKMSKLSAWDI